MKQASTEDDITPYPFVWHDDEGRKWRGELRWGRQGTRVDCTGMSLEAPAGLSITSTVLRRLPIGELMSTARSKRRRFLRWAAQVPYGIGIDVGNPALNAVVRGRDRRVAALRLAQEWKESHGGRPGPKGLGPEHFAEVAATYLEALNATGKPTKAVADRFTVSKSTAAKWVARCRTMGLLPPAQKGKAG